MRREDTIKGKAGRDEVGEEGPASGRGGGGGGGGGEEEAKASIASSTVRPKDNLWRGTQYMLYKSTEEINRGDAPDTATRGATWACTICKHGQLSN